MAPSGLVPQRRSLISLIGYRGTGKTTVAKLLAARIGWSWLDADAELERMAQRTIRDIFAEGGESAFRDWEASTVVRLVEHSRTVVAWGGGVILRDENRAAIRRGWVFWLTADPKTIQARIEGDPITSQRRPNLTVGGGLEEIQRLLSLREPLYRDCADFTVDSVRKTPEQVAGDIVCFLQQRAVLENPPDPGGEHSL
ncbi:MAG: shikimate kinase [Pirellulaceae bacterium]